MATTSGLNHLGLTVLDLQQTRDFFVELLGWHEQGYDASYPRTAVTDGEVRLTLWQVDKQLAVEHFDRRKNVGLHHVALQIDSQQGLVALHQKLQQYAGVTIEFGPELVGKGPRQHMMCLEPGGLRVEFIWPGV